MSIERTVHTKETEEAFYWPECEYRLKCPFCQGAGDDELWVVLKNVKLKLETIASN